MTPFYTPRLLLRPLAATDVDGMFALAIWDGRRQTLLVARDRIGIKPLYYYADDQHFLFASEMKSLLASPQVPDEVDPAALGEYFHLLSIPDERCILKGVHKLLPGHYLKVSRRGIEQQVEPLARLVQSAEEHQPRPIPAPPASDRRPGARELGQGEPVGDDDGVLAQVLDDDVAGRLGDGDPGGLLAAVLQGVQAVVGQLADVLARRPDAEDAALLADRLLLDVRQAVGQAG